MPLQGDVREGVSSSQGVALGYTTEPLRGKKHSYELLSQYTSALGHKFVIVVRSAKSAFLQTEIGDSVAGKNELFALLGLLRKTTRSMY